MLMLTNVAEFLSVNGRDLCVGDSVYLREDSSAFTVEKIQQVVGVDLAKSRFGEHLIDLDKLTSIPLPIPRLKLQADNGAWYGYWYPSLQVFVSIDHNGTWENAMSTNIQRCVFKRNILPPHQE